MIESLAAIMSDFAGDVNRVRCLAHIVNLVVKIILRQFDMPKKKGKKEAPAHKDGTNNPDLASVDQAEAEIEITGDEDDDIDELLRVLDKEEKEMDDTAEGDDEESENLVRDVERIEEAMKEEIKGVSEIAKPVRQVLFKVGISLGPRASFFFLTSLPLLSHANYLISASKTRLCDQEFNNDYFTAVE
jgi:hypothetical protein